MVMVEYVLKFSRHISNKIVDLWRWLGLAAQWYGAWKTAVSVWSSCVYC